ncbi:MAG: hypothetical protein ABH838_00340 [Actinomycetota bacterium]
MKHLIVLGRKIEAKVARQAGTSLMEVLLACSLTVILLTAAYSVAIGVISSYNTVSARSDAQSTAQDAITKLSRDIRQAEKPLLYVYSTPGYYEQLAFKADLNDDGTSEAILFEFHIYTKRITRKVNVTGAIDFVGMPVEVISENVANGSSEPVFTYYGTDPDTPLVLTDPAADVINKVRNIRIRVVIDGDPNKPPSRVELNTDVKLRNFAYGATR